jgi:acetyltransferase
MTIRNLDTLFRPTSIALVGASKRPHSVGAVIAANLRDAGFAGRIFAVNPKHTNVGGLPCYPDIASLPITPDLAIICTPVPTVPALIAQAGARGTKAAVVVTAGFSEGGQSAGRALQQQMLEAARPHLLRIVGPNCLGILSTPAKLNASFAQTTPKPGQVAFVAQSGAMVTTVLDWAGAREIGFSHLVSLGDMSDVDFGDMLDWLAADASTGAILLYIEAVTHARKFLSAARSAARSKPVIAVKAGRQGAAARAAASHTGALAGMDAVYDAAFLRAGILRVFDLDEIFDAVETLATHPRVSGNRLAIVTNGGGVGVLATDSLIAQGGELARVSDETMTRLDAVLPPTWSHGNPIDIIGDADGARYSAALGALIDTPEIDAVLVLNCPTAVASAMDAARAVLESAPKLHKPLFTNWLGAQSADQARCRRCADPDLRYAGKGDAGRDASRPLSQDPGSVDGSAALASRRFQTGCRDRAPRDRRGNFERSKLARSHRCAGRACGVWVPGAPNDARRRLRTGGRFRCQRGSARRPEDRLARHHTQIRCGWRGAQPGRCTRSEGSCRSHARTRRAGGARVRGFVVQEMIKRPEAYELILGMARDATFGPFLLFGHGGTAVQVIDDKAIGLPPLNLKLAREMMARTRIWKQLKGYRDRPRACSAVADSLRFR